MPKLRKFGTNEGIAMLMAHSMSLYMTSDQGNVNFECNDFLLEDNFGNRMMCDN